MGTTVPFRARAGAANLAGMNKRNVATLLWFVAGWSLGGLVTGLTGAPAVLGALPGVVIAGLVRWDPKGWLWAAPASGRRVTPINDFAEELERQPATAAAELPTTR